MSLVSFSTKVAQCAWSTERSSRTILLRCVTLPLWLVLVLFTMALLLLTSILRGVLAVPSFAFGAAAAPPLPRATAAGPLDTIALIVLLSLVPVFIVGTTSYLRPLRIAQIKAVFDLAHGEYTLAFRGFHALLVMADGTHRFTPSLDVALR